MGRDGPRGPEEAVGEPGGASGGAPEPAGDPPSDGPLWQVALVVEVALLAIALLMPLTPTKTGSQWSPATLVWDEPGYLHEVLFWLVATHLLAGLLGAAAWIAVRRGRGSSG